MNKTQLIDVVAKHAGISRSQARMTFDTIVETISDTLAQGERVAITGFGTFITTDKETRRGINPRTLMPMTIDARRSIKFKPAPILSDRVK